MKKVIILGAGPAGLTAGIYTSRAKIQTIAIEQFFPGGKILNTEKIENYPGFPTGISGEALAKNMKEQFEKLGGEIIAGEVEEVILENKEKIVKLKNGKYLESRVLIIATGSSKKKIGVEGEEEFVGKGVSYCALCDGAFFKDKTVAIIGGGFSAFEETIYLTKFACRCYLIHRREKLRIPESLQKEFLSHPKIVSFLPFVLEKIEGKEKVEKIILRNTNTGEKKEIFVDGVFISIGEKPNSDFLIGKVDMDKDGYIITNEKMETSISGVFACGDVRKKDVYQIITACSDGAIAGIFAEKYLYPI